MNVFMYEGGEPPNLCVAETELVVVGSADIVAGCHSMQHAFIMYRLLGQVSRSALFTLVQGFGVEMN